MKKTTGDKIADILAAITLAILLMVIAISSAHADTNTKGKVLLLAVLNGQALMQKVRWVVTNEAGAEILDDTRHSINLELEGGDYVARLHCNGKNYSRVFSVASSHRQVVVACD